MSIISVFKLSRTFLRPLCAALVPAALVLASNASAYESRYCGRIVDPGVFCYDGSGFHTWTYNESRYPGTGILDMICQSMSNSTGTRSGYTCHYNTTLSARCYGTAFDYWRAYVWHSDNSRHTLNGYAHNFACVAGVAPTADETSLAFQPVPDALTRGFEAFRRARTPADALPAGVTAGLSRHEVSAVQSRQIGPAEARMYVVPGARSICLVQLASDDIQDGYSIGCSEDLEATLARGLFSVSQDEHGTYRVSGLLPDGARDVQVVSTSRASSVKAEGSGFMFTSTEAPEAVSWGEGADRRAQPLASSPR